MRIEQELKVELFQTDRTLKTGFLVAFVPLVAVQMVLVLVATIANFTNEPFVRP